ncbi:unnamed protein product [Linum trigynum]|uniref:Uncharacterized protein n=1 Tax=Linum trigynum TaxID=586398 RepID=A0AAV2D0Z4_9ROSI
MATRHEEPAGITEESEADAHSVGYSMKFSTTSFLSPTTQKPPPSPGDGTPFSSHFVFNDKPFMIHLIPAWPSPRPHRHLQTLRPTTLSVMTIDSGDEGGSLLISAAPQLQNAESRAWMFSSIWGLITAPELTKPRRRDLNFCSQVGHFL